jgi:hypothetical protein
LTPGVPARRLILLEGMIGAGKSTTAARLAAWLVSCGENARAYDEFADDHPIRLEAVDRLRGVAVDPSAYGVPQWGALARRCARGETVVLDGAMLQNSVLPLFLDEATPAGITEAFAGIARQIAPVDPLLVYLRPSDIAAAVDRVHAERGEPWSSRNREAVWDWAWARRRGLVGRHAVVEIYRAWERVVDELLEASTLASTIIVDPQRDWPDAMRRICAAVDPLTSAGPAS